MSARQFGEDMRSHLARVEETNAEVLDRVAARMLEVITGDGLIYVGGTGHSMSLMLESFYRAGGLACVQPMYSPVTTSSTIDSAASQCIARIGQPQRSIHRKCPVAAGTSRPRVIPSRCGLIAPSLR